MSDAGGAARLGHFWRSAPALRNRVAVSKSQQKSEVGFARAARLRPRQRSASVTRGAAREEGDVARPPRLCGSLKTRLGRSDSIGRRVAKCTEVQRNAIVHSRRSERTQSRPASHQVRRHEITACRTSEGAGGSGEHAFSSTRAKRSQSQRVARKSSPRDHLSEAITPPFSGLDRRVECLP